MALPVNVQLRYWGIVAAVFLLLLWFLPIGGLMDPIFEQQPLTWDKLKSILVHLIVPTFVIGTSGASAMTQRLRANMLDELGAVEVKWDDDEEDGAAGSGTCAAGVLSYASCADWATEGIKEDTVYRGNHLGMRFCKHEKKSSNCPITTFLVPPAVDKKNIFRDC